MAKRRKNQNQEVGTETPEPSVSLMPVTLATQESADQGWSNFDAWRRKTGLLPVNTNEPNRDETGRLIPGGASLNPNGRPKGSLNQSTKLQRALESIAKKNSITVESLEDAIIGRGAKEALKDSGDFRYWKELTDRILGKSTDKVVMDLTTGGMPIQGGNQITFIDFSGKEKKNASESQP